jgi:23S rRNA pseudouridine2605 synthase
MKVSIDRQQGANGWMTIEIKEGKNREIRRALSQIGMQVNRLIRVEYGPFKLGSIKKGEIIEINKKSMRRSLKSVNINMTRENMRQSTEQKKFSAVSRKTPNKR